MTASVVGHVLRLPRVAPTVLGVGAFLKNSLCILRGDEALLSHDVGNLDTFEAVERFEDTAARLLGEAGIAAKIAAHDLHPDFHSTRYAATLGIETVPVQHHHAHVATVMAEHGLCEPVIGLALDGFGLGPDNQSWGGELLYVEPGGFKRLGHLKEIKQPGGDVAARQPWRMGAAVLHAMGRSGEIAERYDGQPGAAVIAQMLERDVNCPPTSSCGRYFDAACGLLGVKLTASFEGEAPQYLESLVSRPEVFSEGWRLQDGVLDLLPLLDRLSGLEAAPGADLFHGTVIAAFTDWAAWGAEMRNVDKVVLSGGCLLNKVVSSGLMAGLAERKLTAYQAERVTPGDGALSLGQAWAAAMARG